MTKDEHLLELYQKTIPDNRIPAELYDFHNVKKGLRNENKTGVLVGLSKICNVIGYRYEDEQKIDCEGALFYRGIDIKDIVKYCSFHPGTFEEVCYLLLFGKLPTVEEYNYFCQRLRQDYKLPEEFITTNILRLPANNLMNKIQRALLMLYEYDREADDYSVENTLTQGLNILAKLPAIISYSYYGMKHAQGDRELLINEPNPNLTIAENILSLVREDQSYTAEEAILLDVIMALHADHGGGNNSTFANIVISSTNTDLYSSFAAAVGALKGPRHGGANHKVKEMLEDAIAVIGYRPTDDAIKEYLNKLLNKEAFDRSGLVYGFGHAVYTLSDPRAEILGDYCRKLAATKNQSAVYDFYQQFERVTTKYFKEEKNHNLCANVDYYSGFAYELLNIPEELYLPIFAVSRTVGWLAHNLENKLYCNKIIRPASRYIGEYYDYQKLEDRK